MLGGAASWQQGLIAAVLVDIGYYSRRWEYGRQGEEENWRGQRAEVGPAAAHAKGPWRSWMAVGSRVE